MKSSSHRTRSGQSPARNTAMGAGQTNDETVRQLPDRSLLQELREGNEEAATNLYRRYAARLRAVIESQLSSSIAARFDADDIVQSVFRRFFRVAQERGYDIPDGEDLWGLLVRIAVNRLRTENEFQTAAKRDIRRSVPADDGTEPSIPSGGHLFLLMIEEALETLPEGHREVMRLRMDGHTVEEISEKLGRAKRSIERLLQESRELLRNLI